MAYVALESAPRASLLARAAARWARLAARRADLRPAVELQRRLIGVALDVLDAVEAGHIPRLSLPPRYVAAKLRRGVPVLTAEPVPVPRAVLSPALQQYCEILAAGGAGPVATNLAAALTDGRIEPGSLLDASLNRDQAAISRGAEHLGLAPDLVWLVAELAVSPFVYALQRRVLSPPDPALARALEDWQPGYCPACGSWPALAEEVDGRAVLRCSFCTLAWALPPDCCAYCRAEPPALTTVTVAGAIDHRLDVCDRCRRYLKIVALETLSPFPLVAISDLETTDLDVDAMTRGFRRPALADQSRA